MNAHAHVLSPDPGHVLTKAVLRTAERLAVARRELSAILGVSAASLSRLAAGADVRSIDPGSKEGELALLFVRVFRSLDAILGGDGESCRRWLRAHNHHLGGVPADLLQTVTGLARVADYLDALRGKS